MNNIDDLKESQLKLIYGFIILNKKKENGLSYNLSSLYNPNYSDEDVMEQLNNITENNNKTVEGKNISFVNRFQLRKLEDTSIDINGLLNPFLSISQLKFLIEFKKQNINIDYVVNEQLTIEEMGSIVNYVLKNGYDELYDLIRYMSRDSLDKLLIYINNMANCIQFLAQYKKERARIIDTISMYQYNYNSHENRELSHTNMVKVYTENRYKKNN